MFREFCIDKVDIVSIATPKDAAGGTIRTPTTVQTGVFCGIQQRSGDQSLAHDIENEVVTSDVLFVDNFGIKVGWEIRPWINAATPPTSTSRTLRVKANIGYEPGQNEVITVVAEERR